MNRILYKRKRCPVSIRGIQHGIALVTVFAYILLSPQSVLAEKKTSKELRAERTLQLQHEKHTQLHERFVVELEKLAEYCDEFQMPDAAKSIRKLSQPVNGDLLVSTDLPETYLPPIPSDIPRAEKEWRTNLRRIQKSYAAGLYELSRNVLRAGHPSFAFDLVREVAMHDPDHKQTRSLLGYVTYFDNDRKKDLSYRGEWVSPFASRMLTGTKKHVWDDRFGWVLKTHLPRYESGQRPWKGKWISAEREAEIRRDFKNAWEVRTDHFLVKTNYSLQRGVEVAQRLETFHAFFMRNFAPFFETRRELEKRFAQASRRRRAVSDPYEVHYYASRNEYNARLVDRIPKIAMTTGMYFQAEQTCYFFDDPDKDNDHTLFHEATHQFLDVQTAHERMMVARAQARKNRQRNPDWSVAKERNFWVVEGFASYIESFKHENDVATLGDRNYSRFRAAQLRLKDDRDRIAAGAPPDSVNYYYMPMQEMTQMGLAAFQGHREIRKNYTQAAGFCHFLMHYNGGQYRDGLIEYLSQIYRPDPKNPRVKPSLAQILGVSYSVLDEQYIEYFNAWPDDGFGFAPE